MTELTKIAKVGDEIIYLHPEKDKLAIELIQGLHLRNGELERKVAELTAINEIYASQLNADNDSSRIVMPN